MRPVTSLLQNLLLHRCSCLWSFLLSVGIHRGACFSAQCGITQPPLREALLAVTHGSTPGSADFRPLERCEIAKGREDWQKYWLWYFITPHFQRVEMHWQPHLSNQILDEVPSTHTGDCDTDKILNRMIDMRASSQPHFCFSLCSISLFCLGGTLQLPVKDFSTFGYFKMLFWPHLFFWVLFVFPVILPECW